MTQAGQIILFPFPKTNQQVGKLRPALLLRKCPTQYNDWLICMISSQLDQQITGIDEIITEEDKDFGLTGLKKASVIRLTRLAVVDQAIFLGSIGNLSPERLVRLRRRLADWIIDA